MHQLDDVSIFRFMDDLQDRVEALMERAKSDLLLESEQAEWDGITDLALTFTFINTQLAAQARWCLVQQIAGEDCRRKAGEATKTKN